MHLGGVMRASFYLGAVRMYDISQLIPHSGKMLLLDSVVDSGEDWLTSQVTIQKESMFCHNGSVSAIIGIEYMAQTIAAFAGKNDKINNQKISIGLLLGTRNYTSSVAEFPIGATLLIHAHQVYFEELGIGVFKCSIEADDILVEANINVYHPNDLSNLINKTNNE